MGDKRLKSPKKSEGAKISVTDRPDIYRGIDYPVFCFRHLQKKYNVDALTSKERHALVERLHKLSLLTWEQIKFADRHGFGTEKIAQNAIKPSLPAVVTPDVTLLALRYNSKKPFVGFRLGFIFHILYVDHDWSVYDHG